jgi:hypothetical protein
MSRGEGRPVSAWAVRLAACAAMLLGSVGLASAQEIEPNEFIPAPDGTSINLGYFVYNHLGTFTTTTGANVPNASGNAYLGVERFVHYDYLFGHPAGFQLIEEFGSISTNNPVVGGAHLNTATGASNVDLSAFFWPIANFQQKEYLVIAGFLYPPVGSYNKNQAVNLATQYQVSGEYNWTGDLQVGWDQGIGEHFSYDLAADGRFFGSTTGPIVPGSGIPISVTTHHNADLRLQVWANWAWNRALTTAIGYEGWFGGNDYIDNPLTGAHTNTAKSYEQRLRGAVGMFLSPRMQVLLEVNGDVARTGGFKDTVGSTLRVLYIF